MGMVITTTIAAVVFQVLWAVDVKPLDAALVSAVILVIGSAHRLAAPFLPGSNRAD